MLHETITAAPQAYIDPTTGGVLLQVLLGGSAAYLVIVRYLGRRIRSLFRRGAPPEE